MRVSYESNTVHTADALIGKVLATDPTPEELDTHIVNIAEAATRGALPERQARQAISGLLMTLHIPDHVAKREPNLTNQERADLADKLTELIHVKATQETDGGLNLTYIAENGSSGAGWARNLARVATKSKLRDHRAHYNKTVAVDPTLASDDPGAPLRYQDIAFHAAAAPAADAEIGVVNTEAAFTALRHDFTDTAAGQRGAGRLRVEAKALTDAYDVPMPIRPDTFADREWIRENVAMVDVPQRDMTAPIDEYHARCEVVAKENEKRAIIARESLRAWYGLVTSSETLAQRAIDDRLIALWDDFTPEEAEVIMGRPAKIALVLVSAAITALPKPNRSVISSAIQVTRMADDGAGWDALAEKLVASWIAMECNVVSDYDSRVTAEVKQQRFSERSELAEMWPQLVQAVITRPGAPLGEDARAVHTWIGNAVTTFIDASVKKDA